MNTDSIKDYARYNLWANKEIAPFLYKFTDDDWIKKDNSSFGTIPDTVTHTYWAEILWTQRLIGAPLQLPDINRIKTRDAVIKDYINYSEQLTDTVISFQDNELHEVVSYRTMAGKVYQNKRYEMIHHCINHSTYHRGQLILMMKNSNIEVVPSTDYITFLNNVNGKP